MAVFEGPFKKTTVIEVNNKDWFLLVDASEGKKWAMIEPIGNRTVLFAQTEPGHEPDGPEGHEIRGRHVYATTEQREFLGSGEYSCWIRAKSGTARVVVTVV